jgi:hypothetical protein
MTPGFGKPRSELPWLPYESKDRVIINSHNFTPVWTPAVNGKMPVAAWVPSRDTAGNGTTTLTDLAGSNNGTLTNMDAATDWVADTGAGGVRALDFDGANDHVIAGLPVSAFPFSMSCWVKYTSTASQGFVGISSSSNNLIYHLLQAASNSAGTSSSLNARSASVGSDYITGSTVTNNGAWHNIVGIWTSATSRSLYIDGSLAGTSSVSRPFEAGLNQVTIGILRTVSPTWYFNGRMDDIRIWDQSLDATDVSDLYASGSGRGIQA